MLHHSLLRINTIEFEELSEERVRREEEEDEEGEVQRAAQPESFPIQEEDTEAMLAEGTVEQGIDGIGDQCPEEQSLGTVVTNNNSVQ